MMPVTDIWGKPSVSIVWQAGGEEHDVTPAWRMSMYLMLRNHGLLGPLNASHIGALRERAVDQQEGNGFHTPYWAEDIKLAFEKLASAIEERGEIRVEAHF